MVKVATAESGQRKAPGWLGWLSCPRLSIRAWLLFCALAAGLPMLLLATWLSQRQLVILGVEQRAQLAQRAEVAARAVQHRLALARAALEVLSESDAAHRDDLDALYQYARRTLRFQTDPMPITLARPDGALLFCTSYPMGTMLPPSTSLREERPVFEQGKTIVTPLVRSAINNHFEVMVAVPLRVTSQVRYSLRMTLPVVTLNAALEEQQWPANWMGLIIDERDAVVARSQEALQWVGRSASPELIQQIHSSNRNPFESTGRDGNVMQSVIRPIAGTSWHLVLGQTQVDFNAVWWRALLRHLWLGGAGLAFGSLVALAIATVVSRQVRRLPEMIEASMPVPLDEASQPVSPRPERRRPDSSPVHEIDQVVEHLSELHQQQLDLAYQLHAAQLDPLTELPARQLFMEASSALLERCRQSLTQVMGLFYLDLDGFKGINDRLGHLAGDQVLRQVGALLHASVREGDIAGRVGGDEFVLCMVFERRAAETTSRAVAQRVIAGTGRIAPGLGCSIGVILALDPALSLEDLIARADTAMLQVKKCGKNHFAFAPAYESHR